MELFDKKYVHFMWEDELEGKEGFFANSVCCLKDYVNDKNKTCIVTKSESNITPFQKVEGDTIWMFFYYDPLYEYKKAFNEGKTIQIKDHIHNKWQDIKHENVLWGETAETGEYRIKPEEPEYKDFLLKSILKAGIEHLPETYMSDEDKEQVTKSIDILCNRMVLSNGIHWHDLRENPNDLPEDTYDVLDQAGYKVHYNFFQNVWLNEKDEIDNQVTHWCEIPQFKE